MMDGTVVPRRIDDVVTKDAGNEIFAFDPEENQIHALNPAAAAVFGLCDDRRTITQIESDAQASAISADMVHLALVELHDAGLILLDTPIEATSRRDLLKKIGVGAAALAAIPVVESIVAPTAAAAASAAGPSPIPTSTPTTTPTPIPVRPPIGSKITFGPGTRFSETAGVFSLSQNGVTLELQQNGSLLGTPGVRVIVVSPAGEVWKYARNFEAIFGQRGPSALSLLVPQAGSKRTNGVLFGKPSAGPLSAYTQVRTFTRVTLKRVS